MAQVLSNKFINHTWIDVLIQNKEAKKNLELYDDKLKSLIEGNKKDTVNMVQREIVSNMTNELEENIKVAEQKILYEFSVYNKEDLKFCKLTAREIEVLKLRMKINRFIKIDYALEFSPGSSYIAYQSAIKKIKKYRRFRTVDQGERNLLSEQQREIFKLMNCKTNKEIAEILKTSIGNVKKQKTIIRGKLRGYQKV